MAVEQGACVIRFNVGTPEFPSFEYYAGMKSHPNSTSGATDGPLYTKSLGTACLLATLEHCNNTLGGETRLRGGKAMTFSDAKKDEEKLLAAAKAVSQQVQ